MFAIFISTNFGIVCMQARMIGSETTRDKYAPLSTFYSFNLLPLIL